MFNINRNIISKILTFIALVILLPLIWNHYFSSGPSQSANAIYDPEKEVTEFLTQTKKRWEEGDRENLYINGKLNCPEFSLLPKDTPSTFFSCNKIYLNCYLKNHFKNSKFDILQSKQSYVNELNGNAILLVKDKTLNKSFSVELESHCHEKYLPKGIYMAGPQSSEDYKWDNYLYDIYIDKYYVSFLSFSPGEDKDLSLPVNNINLDLAKEHCHNQNKVLLESRYFDAATFYPSSNKVIYKHPFQWTKSHKSFLTRKNEVTREDCMNAYVLGCKKYQAFNNFDSLGISWMGINHALGGMSEVFQNTFEPRANLKVSNADIERTSLWHRLGRRGYWNGNDFNNQSFQDIEQYTNKMINISHNIKGVAFRCARLR